jgi:hypothetical protein
MALSIETAFDVGVGMLLRIHLSYDATQMRAQVAESGVQRYVPV